MPLRQFKYPEHFSTFSWISWERKCKTNMREKKRPKEERKKINHDTAEFYCEIPPTTILENFSVSHQDKIETFQSCAPQIVRLNLSKLWWKKMRHGGIIKYARLHFIPKIVQFTSSLFFSLFGLEMLNISYWNYLLNGFWRKWSIFTCVSFSFRQTFSHECATIIKSSEAPNYFGNQHLKCVYLLSYIFLCMRQKGNHKNARIKPFIFRLFGSVS